MKTINFIITHNCNFYCKHCYLNCDSRGENACYSKIIESVKYFKSKGFTHILLSGGECTVHPNLNKIILAIKEIGLSVSLFSNCSLLSEDCVDLLESIYLSLDGLKEYHDNIRGVSGSYNAVIKIMEYCMVINKKIHIQSTIFDDNYKEIEKLIPIYKKYSKVIVSIKISAISHIGRGINDFSKLNYNEICFLTKKIQENVGYSINVINNLYLGSLSAAYYTDKMKFILWADVVNDVCYVIEPSNNIKIEHYDEQWEIKEQKRIIANISRLDPLPKTYILDDLLYKASKLDLD